MKNEMERKRTNSLKVVLAEKGMTKKQALQLLVNSKKEGDNRRKQKRYGRKQINTSDNVDTR